MLEQPGDARAFLDTRSPEVVAEGRAGVRELLEGIANLPIEQRHALVRREVDGASYAQVADGLGDWRACRARLRALRCSLHAMHPGARCPSRVPSRRRRKHRPPC
jgi:DNA-directed RNA polymerase specialized sigma24 family protein